MQTVTADAINSKNKQKGSQVQTNCSRKFQENKGGRKTPCSQKCKQTQLIKSSYLLKIEKKNRK